MSLTALISDLITAAPEYRFKYRDLLSDGNVGTVLQLDGENCIQWFVEASGTMIPTQEIIIDLSTWPRAPDTVTVQIDANALVKKGIAVEVVDVGCSNNENCGPGWEKSDAVFHRKFSNDAFALDFVVRPVLKGKIRPLDPKIRVKPSN